MYHVTLLYYSAVFPSCVWSTDVSWRELRHEASWSICCGHSQTGKRIPSLGAWAGHWDLTMGVGTWLCHGHEQGRAVSLAVQNLNIGEPKYLLPAHTTLKPGNAGRALLSVCFCSGLHWKRSPYQAKGIWPDAAVGNLHHWLARWHHNPALE